MGAVNLVKRDLIKLESFQGSVLKQVCGIGNRSHHTRLVRALSIDSISTDVRNHSSTFLKRICSVDSPTQQLCFYMLSDYILNNNLVPGSTVSRIANLDLSPVDVIFNKVTQIHESFLISPYVFMMFCDLFYYVCILFSPLVEV